MRRGKSGQILPTALLLLIPCLSGCHQPREDASPTGVPPVTVQRLHGKPAGDAGKKLVRQNPEDQPTITADSGPAHGPPSLAQWTPVQNLVQTSVSPGLVVCDPIPVQAGAGTADFGAGCGRWLQFSVAGLPQMGETPLWSSLSRAEKEMGRTDLRLALPEARRLASILGANYAAVGQITGSAAHCTLSYQVYSIPDATAVGPPLRAVGTEAQVLKQMPRLARSMAAALSVPAASLPLSLAAGPAEIGMLGRLAWYPDADLPPAQTRQLQMLAARLPLAGFFLVNTSGDLSDSQWSAAVRALLARQPENALVWAQIGYSSPSLLALSSGQMARNIQRYPQNYLFATANTWMQRRLQNDQAEIQAAEQTAQNAPRNPDAWLTLGSTISEHAARFRQARLASDITPSEWAVLNQAYPQWYEAVSRAANLDPLFGKAWDRTAQAATFAGHRRQADGALWRDIALNKTNPGAYAWGLQMYQSKWGGDSAKLLKIAESLTTIPYPSVAQGLYAVKILKDNEEAPDQYLPQRQALLTRLLAQTQQAIAHNPGDAQAHYDQAYALSLAGRKQRSVAEYQNVVVLRPTDPQSYFDLAQEYDQAGQIAPAVSAYRSGLRLDPASAFGHYNLGWDLKEQGQLPPAEAEMRRAVKLSPLYPDAHAGLAQVLANEHHDKEATAQMQRAVSLNPFLTPATTELCSMLDEQGRYAESLAAGRHALQINRNDNNSIDTMADDYLHFKLWDRSIQMSQAALQIAPGDALAHENLGEAYLGQGKKAEARAEWQQVLTLDHGVVASVARGMLAKYP